MSWASSILLGLALAMDCFVVSLGLGLTKRRLSPSCLLLPPLMFGLFQGLMPLVGWGMGLTLRPLIESFDHWVAFILLLGVGGHMLKEAWEQFRAESSGAAPCPTAPHPVAKSDETALRACLTLLTLAVATSLDAMAIGLGMAFAEVSLWLPALVISCTTFLVSLAGIALGRALGRFINGSYCAVALGGCVLIGIGFKILMDHSAL